MESSDSDNSLKIDIIEHTDDNDATVEIAKQDLTLIFNKINRSLSDLETINSECDTNKRKTFKEKSEVSFKINLENHSNQLQTSKPKNVSSHHNRYSPEMRFCVPSPPAVAPPKSSLMYQPSPRQLIDQCVVHYPYGMAGSGSISNSQSQSSLTPMMWSHQGDNNTVGPLSWEKFCTGGMIFYWIIGIFMIIIILLVCIILLLT